MKRKKKGRKINASQVKGGYEGFRYGPLKVERLGRMIIMKNEATSEENARFRDELKAQRPNLRTAIDEKLARLQEIIQTYDPVELLTALSTAYTFSGDTEEDPRLEFAEFSVSMVAAVPPTAIYQSATKESIDDAKKLIEDIFNEVRHYFGSEAAEHEKVTVENIVRYSAILDWLFVRGETYPDHYLQLMRDEFIPHDRVLQNAYRITTEDVIAFSKDIIRQIEEATNQTAEVFQAAAETQKLLGELSDTRDFATSEELADAFNELPEVKLVRERLAAVPKSYFEIDPGKLPLVAVEHLTLARGDNEPFRFHKAVFWPTNSSLIYEKPLLRIDGKLYCFIPQTFFINLRKVLQALIDTADHKYFTKQYRKKRGDLLEEQSIDLLARRLPGAKVYRSMYYHIVENGEQKRPEADGIILFDTYMFIIEAKGAELSESGRRGGLERVRRELGEIVTKGQTQQARTLEYIQQNNKPVFENQDGSIALVLEKDKYPHITPIVTSLEDVSFLMASMKDMVEMGIVATVLMPWFVSLSDLRVVTDIVESPAQLILYIERRRRLYNIDFYRSADELDSFGHYLKEGLYFEDIEGTAPTVMTLTGYSKTIDTFYKNSGEKPRLNIPQDSRELIKSLEESGLEGRTDFAIEILNYDWKSQDAIAKQVKCCLSQTALDSKDHSTTVASYNDETAGLTFVTYKGNDAQLNEVHHQYSNYARIKRYQLRKSKWLLVFINQESPEKVRLIDTLKGDWSFDEELEKRVQEFASNLVARERAVRKIGRNEPCPCNSGKKYKNCCLNLPK